MKKRDGKKFISLFLSFILIFCMIPVTSASANVNQDEPEVMTTQFLDNKYEERELKNPTYLDNAVYDPQMSGISLDEESLTYLESYADMLEHPVGAVGFDNEYALDDNAELVDIIVMMDTLPSAILTIYSQVHNLGISENDAVKIAEKAIYSFTDKLDVLSNSQACEITQTYSLLGTGVAMTVPANMVEQIAALDGVYSVTPDFIQYAHTTTNNSDFVAYGMKDSRDVLRTEELNDMGYTGTGIKVGVIDTGSDYNHPDLTTAYDISNVAYRKDLNASSRGLSSSRGYDFVDNDNDPNETTYADWLAVYDPAKPTVNPESNGSSTYYTSHGTHVSGEIGGRGLNTSANLGYATKGLAPEVQLMAYRVLGPYGSGSESNVIAAVERSVADGCKVINMSLGSETTIAYDSEAMVLNNAVLAGTVVCVSAGNSGATIGVSSIGSPGIAYLAMTVAAANYGGVPMTSYDNSVSVSDADDFETPFSFKVEGYDFDNQFIDGAFVAPNLNLVEGKGYEYVVLVNDEGTLTDISSLKDLPNGSLEGKILVVKRGAITFTDIPVEAKRLKAGAIVIINKEGEDGYLSGITLSGRKHDMMPILTVTRHTGYDVVAAYNRAQQAGVPAYINVGKLTIEAMPRTLADFSSMGPLLSGTYAIKPDITAPGVRILSTQPAWLMNANHDPNDYKDAYELMNGTSMSSPHMAACAALMRQAYPDAAPQEIKARLMNTAELLEEENSVYETGAGFVNIYNAITQRASYVTVTDAYLNGTGSRIENNVLSSLSFGSVGRSATGETTSKSLPLVIHNTSDVESTFSFEVNYNDSETRFSKSSTANGVELRLSAETVTVAAGETATVNASIFFPATAAFPGTYEGRVTVHNQTKEQDATIPFAARLGVAAGDVDVSDNYLLRPLMTSATSSSIYSSTYAQNLQYAVEFTGRPSKMEVYITDLEGNPVAYNGSWAVTTNNAAPATTVLVNAVTQTVYKYDESTQTYAANKTALADGVYQIVVKVYPYDNQLPARTLEPKKFVVDGRAPIFTFDTVKVKEYDYGTSELVLKGNVWSYGAALCEEYQIPCDLYNDSPVLGQDANGVTLGTTTYMFYCDENGDFEIPITPTAASRTSQISMNAYASEYHIAGYYRSILGSLTGPVYFGNNRTPVVTFKYTETPAPITVTATDGTITALLSNTPVNTPSAEDFKVEYSINGGDYAGLPITGYSFNTRTASFTFEPLAKTTYDQNIVVKVTYRSNFKTSTPFIIEPENASLVSVTANNSTGKLKINFDSVLSNIPTAEDFEITWSGGLNPSDTEQELKNYTFAGDTATFDFTPYVPCDEEQNVVFTVTYKGITISAEPIFVAKSSGYTPIEDVDIVFITPAAVSVAKSKTVQLKVETDPYIDVTQAPYSLTWKSLNTSVATVNSSGVVTGKAAGMTMVQATITDPYGTAIVLEYLIMVK